MNVEFMKKVIPMYVEAGKITLIIGFGGISLAILVGLFCCYIIYFKVRGFQHIVKGYIELSRNTPLLVQVFFLYFGLPSIGIKLSGTLCGIIGLGFLGGSYMAESFRGGLEAVARTQVEAAMSIGLSRWEILQYVILPQAFSVSIPQIAANVIFLLKETSILGGIAIGELVYTAKGIIGLYYKTNEALLLLTISYLIIILPISILFRLLERRLRHAEFGN